MPTITQLEGVRLNSLQTIPSLSDSTYFFVQRNSNTSEKATISSLKTYLNITYDINAALSTHASSVDPHGDRGYTQTLLNSHNSETDPHNHKAYTNNTLTVHLAASDPHGDRAYSDTNLGNHLSDLDPHGLVTSLEQAIQNHANLENTHNIQGQINTAITSLRNVENGFASLDSTLKIPSAYLPTSNQDIVFTYSKPAIGNPNVLYVDLTDNKQYYWGPSNSYVALTPTLDIGSISLTTDNVPQSTTNLNRRYYTEAIETSINTALAQKVSTVNSSGTGKSVVKAKSGSTLTLKSIKGSSSITVVENTDDLTLQVSTGITELAYDNTTNIGYKRYSSGLLEVFGNVPVTVNTGTPTPENQITLPVTFSNTNYTLITSLEDIYNVVLIISDKEVDGFKVVVSAGPDSGGMAKLNFQCIGITS